MEIGITGADRLLVHWVDSATIDRISNWINGMSEVPYGYHEHKHIEYGLYT